MILNREEQAKDEMNLARCIEGFRRTWKPEDHDRVRDFEIELYHLIETVRRVGQAPLVAQMSAALALVPPRPFIIEKDAGEQSENAITKSVRSQLMEVCETCKWWNTAVSSSRPGHEDTRRCQVNPPRIDKRTGLGVWPFTEGMDGCKAHEFYPELP